MKRLKKLFSKSLLYHLWQEFWIRYYFKFVLPRITQAEIEGLRLDLSDLSPKVRNRILNIGYESQEKQMCLDFLSPEDAVVELGGAIGFIALVCQKKVGIRQYAVFEANPRTFEVLKRNFALNGLTPQAWNLALGPEDGMVDLEVGGDFWDHSICSSNRASTRQTIQVPSATLPSIFKLAGFDPNVLIIDVEGAEALIDFSRLPEHVEKIIIELHPQVIGPQKTCEIIAALVGKGFQAAREEAGAYVFLKQPATSGAGDSRKRSGLVREQTALAPTPGG
jgi:FkbM family methyltransferase